MAYWDSNIIEYEESKRPSCRMCRYFDSDKSCEKNGRYIPDIGYGFWRYCDYFELDVHYDTEEIREKIHGPKGRIRHNARKQHDQKLSGIGFVVGDRVVGKDHRVGKVRDVTDSIVSVDFPGARKFYKRKGLGASGELKHFGPPPADEETMEKLRNAGVVMHRSYGPCKIQCVKRLSIDIEIPMGRTVELELQPALDDKTIVVWRNRRGRSTKRQKKAVADLRAARKAKLAAYARKKERERASAIRKEGKAQQPRTKVQPARTQSVAPRAAKPSVSIVGQPSQPNKKDISSHPTTRSVASK